jgi:protein ImuB
LVHRQQELFVTDLARDRQRHLAELLDQLTSRLGTDGVVRARRVSDAQPEQVCRYEPILLSGATTRVGEARLGNTSATSGSRAARRGQQAPLSGRRRRHRAPQPERAAVVTFRRPLRLARKPLAVEAWSVVPDGPLLRFRWMGGEERVARSWGPERIETGWWRGRAVRRDYYQIETTTGRRYWLFRRLDDRRWFLHGWFE